MKFIQPGTITYRLLQILSKIMLVNLIMLLSMVSMIGLSLGLQISKTYLSDRSIIAFIKQSTIKSIIMSILASIISIFIIFLATLNIGLLPSMTMRYAYIFLYVCIVFIIIVINMFFQEMYENEIRLSQIIGISFINYPKFIFFFSLASGAAFLMSQSSWLFAVILLYIGGSITLIFSCINTQIKNTIALNATIE